MSRITLDLLRKRSEHNEGEISTLEEIALHQENIEKIELIDKTCKHLKILLLQHNLISKIENLSKLKKLEYLNLALNNVEAIENLEGLESLKKLDLTVNFIGDLTGVVRLRCNQRLEQLFLMGNPCADYTGYREYVIATLPQLKELDGTQIHRSERIKALQAYARIGGEIVRNCARQKKIREAEILDYRERTITRKNADHRLDTEEGEKQEEDEDQVFWRETSRHTPEERVAIANRLLRKEEQDRGAIEKSCVTYKPKLFSPEGKPYNVNQAKISFKLDEQQYNDRILLEVALYKHLDTCYVQVDVQPDYVRVTIKGKVLQLTLPYEVSISGSTAQRNTSNGNLLVTMPRFNPLAAVFPDNKGSAREMDKRNRATIDRGSLTSVREYLEIGPATDRLHFSKIVDRANAAEVTIERNQQTCKNQDTYREDDSEVPPLE